MYDFDYQLIERYEEIKKRIGRTPKWDELNPNVRYLIKKNYQNYGNFLSSIGDAKHKNKHTDEELRKEYIRVRELVGRVPTGADLRANSLFPPNQFHAYPLTKLQRECGDRPNVERGVSKEELKRAYFALEAKVGHPPAIKEIDEKGEYRSSYYVKRWGNFDGFLRDIGRTRTEAGLPRVYTKEEVVAIYSLIKILLSVIKENNDYKINQTVLERLRFNDGSVISPTTFTNKFGSWKAFVEYMEENNIDIRIEQLTSKIRHEGIGSLFVNMDEKQIID